MNVRLELREAWTSEEFATLVRWLEAWPPEDRPQQLEVSWRGRRRPSLWQLAWVAECVGRLREEGIACRWSTVDGPLARMLAEIAGGVNVGRGEDRATG